MKYEILKVDVRVINSSDLIYSIGELIHTLNSLVKIS